MSDYYMGEIRAFPYTAIPPGWQACDGTLLNINQHQALYSLLHTTFGGDGKNTFAVPDLRGRVAMGGSNLQGAIGGEETHLLINAEIPLHTHPAFAKPQAATLPNAVGAFWGQPLLSSGDKGAIPCYGEVPLENMAPTALGWAGGTQVHPNMQPYAVLTFAMALQGLYPASAPQDAFIGEIRMLPYTLVQLEGWFLCDGRELGVKQYPVLAAVIGSSFGGDNLNYFFLPNLLQPTSEALEGPVTSVLGNLPMGAGQGPGLTKRVFAKLVGENTVTLYQAQFPSHTHAALASNNLGSQIGPGGHTWANAKPGAHPVHAYVPATPESRSVQLAPNTIAAYPVEGGGGPHNNLQPYIQMCYYICYDGAYPSPGDAEDAGAVRAGL